MLDHVQKIIGNSNAWELSRLKKKIGDAEKRAEKAAARSDEELRQSTDSFRRRLSEGETLSELLPEAFAVVREAAFRTIGLRHYDVQLWAGAALFEGGIVEMKTGEGKTLSSTLAGYMNALLGQGVHIVTANEYLAVRDSNEMGTIYRFLGLSVGCTLNGMTREQKRFAYACDVTYGTASEFGFDYLRDHLSVYNHELVQRPLHYALIDEVDSILIDEARTPLIISGKGQRPSMLYYRMNRFVIPLLEGFDFAIDENAKAITLTGVCIRKAEREFLIDNLFDPDHALILHHLNQALRAHHLIRRDVDYVVKDNTIQLVDANTGRVMPGRRYSDGLHQAIEEKEGVYVGSESVTQAAVTLQHYFSGYPKLAGMTGTAVTEHNEFRQIYGMPVVEIPTRLPCIRTDLPDLVYLTEAAKNRAILAEVRERHDRGQPVLIGTISIEKSERLSVLLQEAGIPHRVLNAHRHAEEAEIIAAAGQKGAVTLATNMAGRGTDIRLDAEAAAAGGLHVIGTERHESRRIDRQLRGRAGRQGDPGSSRFFVSLEDSLFQRFGSESIKRKMRQIGHEEDRPIEGKLVNLSIESAQHVVEGISYDTLLDVIQFDDVINRHRRLIYRDREEVLLDRIDDRLIPDMIAEWSRNLVSLYCPESDIPEEWNLEGIRSVVNPLLDPDLRLEPQDLWEKKTVETLLIDKLNEAYRRKGSLMSRSVLRNFEKYVVLRHVDRKWLEHLDAMDVLRQGIHLRAYSGSEPLQEYEQEGHLMFLSMIGSLQESVCKELLNVQIVTELPSSTSG